MSSISIQFLHYNIEVLMLYGNMNLFLCYSFKIAWAMPMYSLLRLKE